MLIMLLESRKQQMIYFQSNISKVTNNIDDLLFRVVLVYRSISNVYNKGMEIVMKSWKLMHMLLV